MSISYESMIEKAKTVKLVPGTTHVAVKFDGRDAECAIERGYNMHTINGSAVFSEDYWDFIPICELN